MNDRDLRRLDLGLLIVFAETMRHRRLTVVAERLGQTQSAISHALARLRDIIGDPLFVRRPHGVEPTAQAIALAPRVDAMIEMARSMLDPPAPFDPATATVEVRIAAPDYHCALFAAPLLALCEAEAPGMGIVFLPFARRQALLALDDGSADIAIGFLSPDHYRLASETLFEQDYAVVARADHPQAARLSDLPPYLAARHLIVSQAGDRKGTVDQALARLGHRRSVVAAVPYFMAALATVASTDLIATVPRALATRFAATFGLVVADPPVVLRRFPVVALRHRRSLGAPAIDWVLAGLRRGSPAATS